MENLDESRALIAPYLGKQIAVHSDGVIFDESEPAVFTLRFADPVELREQLYEIHTDELDMEPWCDLVPIAAVSVPERSADEFAWVFLDWRDAGSKPPTRYRRSESEWLPLQWANDRQPSILVATHDNWGGSDCFLSADSLEALLNATSE